MADSKEEPAQPQAAPPPGAVEETTAHDVPTKRRAEDDDIQFISANPVKKRRMTEQKAVRTSQGSMPPPPPPSLTAEEQTPTVKQQSPTTEQVPPVNRSQSLCGSGQARGHLPEAVSEPRGTSLTALENFAFPKSFPPLPTQPSRLSLAVSPKQLPQAFTAAPQLDPNANHSLPSSPGVAPQKPIALDQISCLDFNGVPINTPGFDLNQIFSADGIMGGLGMNNSSTKAAPVPPLNSLTAQNAIPFAMYSTGNIMTMPQNGTNQPPAVFPSLPMQHQPQQHGAFAPQDTRNSQVHYPANHHRQESVPREQPTSNRSPTPAPGQKPACLHCARLRQDNLLRRAQPPPPLPGPAIHTHQQHMCPPPATPVISHPAPAVPILPPLGPIPRSAPAGPQPVSAPLRQHQHQHQHLPGMQFPPAPAPGMFPALTHLGPSPNLLLDIAQTIKASFPYAQVAARHGVTPARVVEVVTGMVVGPLLRGSERNPGMGYHGA